MQSTSFYTFLERKWSLKPFLASHFTKNVNLLRKFQKTTFLTQNFSDGLTNTVLVKNSEICQKSSKFEDWIFTKNLMKMDSLTHFLSKNVYNDVLCIIGSKVTALNIFYHYTAVHYLLAVE